MQTITLDAASMLALWKRAHGYEPARTDCSIKRVDGPDLDSLLSLEMRQWYVKRLMEMPCHSLPLTDIASSVSTVASSMGAASVTLPERCLRVASVKMANWDRPAIIVTDHDCADALAQANPFARAGCARPVALAEPGHLTLIPGNSTLSHLLCVMLPDDETSYILNPAMIAEIGDAPTCLSSILL